jgi:drug/metabolite transporter (DMT)-like permease
MASTLRDAATPDRAKDATRPGVWLTDLSLLLMALIWGVNFSVVKYGTRLIAPLAYNSVRVSLAAVTLIIVVRIIRERWPARRDVVVLLALGALGNGVYQLLFIEGVSRTRAGDAALVIAATPAFIALIGRMRGTERVALRGAIGIALSIAGIGLVVSGTGAAVGRTALLGDAMILGGSLCWSVYSILLQPYTARLNGVPVTALTMLGGAIPLVAISIPSIVHTSWTHMPVLGWGAIAYSGLGALVIAYLLWFRGMRVLGPTRTAMYSNLQPLFALLFAWLTLGEVPTMFQAIGAACIMGGLLLTRA